MLIAFLNHHPPIKNARKGGILLYLSWIKANEFVVTIHAKHFPSHYGKQRSKGHRLTPLFPVVAFFLLNEPRGCIYSVQGVYWIKYFHIVLVAPALLKSKCPEGHSALIIIG